MRVKTKLISALIFAGSTMFLGAPNSFTEEVKLNGKELFNSEKFRPKFLAIFERNSINFQTDTA